MSEPLPIQLLLVEDSADIANMVMLTLRQIGLEPQHAINGNKAVELLDQFQPDLILLDLNLPGLNGWQVLEYARKKYADHVMHVIVTTANSDASNRLVGKLQYVDHYLTKPYSPRDLLQLIKDILNIE